MLFAAVGVPIRDLHSEVHQGTGRKVDTLHM